MTAAQTLWVVGESFSRSTVHPQLLTVPQLRERLTRATPGEPLTVVPGLGLDEHA